MNKLIAQRWWIGAVLAIAVVAVAMRTLYLGSIPRSLYWEEVALGYDAYSILETGKDHHGHPWPLVAFESFGDWKPSLYFYTVVPFIKVFGLGTWAVKMPAVLSGLLMVAGVGILGWLVHHTESTNRARAIGILSAAPMAVSPWAIIFSRGGWEVMLASALILWAVISFVMFDQRRSGQYLVASVGLFVLSMYAYHAARVIAPLLGVSLAIWWWRRHELKEQWRLWLLAVGVALVLLVPLIRVLGDPVTQQRVAETNRFADFHINYEVAENRQLSGDSVISKLLFHRWPATATEVVETVLLHLNPSFLFVTGDTNIRHSPDFFGQLYYLDAVLLAVGVIWLIRNKHDFSPLLLVWLVIGILPASVSTAAPHALRILPTLPVWMLVIGTGGWALWQWADDASSAGWNLWGRRAVVAVLCVGYLGLVVWFWRYYTTIYPIHHANETQYGTEQMVERVVELESKYPDQPVFIERYTGRPAMYYWFYTQTDPRRVQAEEDTARKDQSEFTTFENKTFFYSTQDVADRGIIATTAELGNLLAGNTEDQISEEIFMSRGDLKEKTIIYDLQGTPVWYIYVR